jgi:phosphopantetheine adenylyltransferase
MEDNVQILNYSAHVLDEFAELIPKIKTNMPGIRKAHEATGKILRGSVKFLLPNGCDLIDISELKQVHVDMARLPYDIVALEAPWILEDGGGGDKGVERASKRIALCMRMTTEIALAFPDTTRFLDEEHGGVCVLPIFWSDVQRAWKLSMGGVFVPYENEVSAYMPSEVSEPTRLANEPLIAAGLATKKIRQFKVAPFVVLAEMFDAYVSKSSRAEVLAQIVSNARDEVSMLLQTGCVLNCTNVQAETVSVAESLNKKRKSKGKEPFFVYKVLQVRESKSTNVGSGGGTHASPRAHLRRGHIRRLEEKTIWVRPSLINAGSNTGAVDKAYRISGIS